MKTLERPAAATRGGFIDAIRSNPCPNQQRNYWIMDSFALNAEQAGLLQVISRAEAPGLFPVPL